MARIATVPPLTNAPQFLVPTGSSSGMTQAFLIQIGIHHYTPEYQELATYTYITLVFDL